MMIYISSVSLRPATMFPRDQHIQLELSRMFVLFGSKDIHTVGKFTILWLHLADAFLTLGIQSLQLLLGLLVVLLKAQRCETTIRSNDTPLWPWIMAQSDSVLLLGLYRFSSALLLLAEF
jgi:hypothetical protein